MNRRTAVLAAAGVLTLAAAAYVGLAYFAPEASTHVDQALGMDARSLVVLAAGEFRDGDALHQVSGTVKVVEGPEGRFLRFENYSATPGPDVYFYLTPSPDPRSTADVEGAGARVLVPGGAEEGRATLRGNFNVPLPEGVEIARFGGIAVWCERFNELFGSAALAPP